MEEEIIETIVNIGFASAGVALLWVAFDWKVAVGAFCMAAFVRNS